MEAYLGEIRIFGGNFAPIGWLLCDGHLRNISDYSTLFSLIGTTYGGDGTTTFAMPNMSSRVAVGMGQGPGLSNYQLGEMQGAESTTLFVSQLPAHQHPITGTISVVTGTPSPSTSPEGTYFGDKGGPAYHTEAGTGALASVALSGSMELAGGSEFHPNVQPVTAIYYIICAEGIYPSRPPDSDAVGESEK